MLVKRLTCPLLLVLVLSFLNLATGCDSQKEKEKEKKVDFSKPIPGAIEREKAAAAKRKAALAPPSVTSDWIHKPRFKTTYGQAVGKVAFTAKLDSGGTPVLITPLSFFGPSSGFKYSAEARQLNNTVKEVELLDPEDRTKANVLKVSPLVTIDANHWGWDSAAGDVAAFQLLDNQEFPAGLFASKELSEQDRTWLVLPGKTESPGTPQLYLVKLRENKRHESSIGTGNPESRLTYSYAISEFQGEAHGLEGAPLVNRQGAIVGVQAKTSVAADGTVYGYAVPTSRFLPSLKRSLKNEIPGPEVEVSGYTLRLPGGYEQVGDFVWEYEDASLNETVAIRVKVTGNEKEIEPTPKNLRKLQKYGVASAAKGYGSYSTSSNPELFSRPGIKMGMTNFSAGGPLKSGVVATGLNKDDIVLLSMEGNVPQDSFHILLANKCFYSFARSGAPTESPAEGSNNPETKTVEVWGAAGGLLDRTKRHLSSVVHDCSGDTVYIDFSTNPLTIKIATALSLDELASQLRIGKPEVDEGGRKLVYQLDSSLRTELLDPKTTAAHLEILELDDGRLAPEKSIKFLCKADVGKADSKEFRKRVAEQLAKRLTVGGGSIDDLLSSLGKWDEEVARRAFCELVETADWPNHFKAAKALLAIADPSVVESAANGLLHHSNLSHFEKPAGKLLQKFPDASEAYLLVKLKEKDYASPRNAVAAIKSLARFGGDKTKAAFKELSKSESDEKILKALKQAIEDFSANPFQ